MSEVMERERQLTFEKPVTDYLCVATASPEVAVAGPKVNKTRIADAYADAAQDGSELLVLPELCVTGYTAGDLFFDKHVLAESMQAVQDLTNLTANGPAMAVGAPMEVDGLLYNCAFMLAEGKVAGVVPKSYLPNAGEFREMRWFTSGKDVVDQYVQIGDTTVPFGVDQLFDLGGAKVGVEICEDAFAAVSPGRMAALAGADIVINLSASNEIIGKHGYRRALVTGHAAAGECAYVYTSAGAGESYGDLVFGGHQIISELGKLAAEAKPLSDEPQTLTYDVDLAYINHDRLVNKTYAEQAADFRATHEYRTTSINAVRNNKGDLLRSVDPYPFVPSNPETLDERCEEIFAEMSYALSRNIKENNSRAIVIGLSGGLDSTLALLTALYTCDRLGVGYDFIHTLTMPGEASSERTQDNATKLAEALGTTHKVVPIGDLAQRTMLAFGHDGKTEDIAYENTQARMRKSIQEDYANMVGGIDLGTGDMSEIAQGWCTFAGDQTSMFNPNSSVPKTLITHLVRWYAEHRANEATRTVLLDILDTPISPELTGKGELSQTTESLIGPYPLHDFFLNEHKRRGSDIRKIGYLATIAFEGEYEEQTIEHWLLSFMKRYTGSQWKREASPNGTKIGPVSLSQRNDHVMAPNTSKTWFL